MYTPSEFEKLIVDYVIVNNLEQNYDWLSQ